MNSPTATAAGAQDFCAPGRTAHSGTATGTDLPGARAKFIRCTGLKAATREPAEGWVLVPQNVVRDPKMNALRAVLYACDRYRFTWGAQRLDVPTAIAWTGVSRAHAYRELRTIGGYVDAHGYELPGMFDPKLGGAIKVRLADVRELGAGNAITLALLRKWKEQPRPVDQRSDGFFQVIAPELAKSAGCDPKTVRKRLELLSTGEHDSAVMRALKLKERAPHGRLVLDRKPGFACYVRVLSTAERSARAMRAKTVRTKPAPKPRVGEQPNGCQQRANASKQAAQDDYGMTDDAAAVLEHLAQQKRTEEAARTFDTFNRALRMLPRR